MHKVKKIETRQINSRKNETLQLITKGGITVKSIPLAAQGFPSPSNDHDRVETVRKISETV